MSDPQLHLLLNRINELTLTVATVRAMCEQRIEEMGRYLGPTSLDAHEVLRVLDGGGSDE